MKPIQSCETLTTWNKLDKLRTQYEKKLKESEPFDRGRFEKAKERAEYLESNFAFTELIRLTSQIAD